MLESSGSSGSSFQSSKERLVRREINKQGFKGSSLGDDDGVEVFYWPEFSLENYDFLEMNDIEVLMGQEFKDNWDIGNENTETQESMVLLSIF